MEVTGIAKKFLPCGNITKAVLFGNGIINETYLVEHKYNNQITRYILRKINKFVFRDPECVIQNSFYAADQIRNKLLAHNEKDITRKTITFIPADDDTYCFIDENKDYWCLLKFIEETFTLDFVSNEHQAYLAAKAFGKFLWQLSDDDPCRYKATIPDFHNTPKRLDLLKKVINHNPSGRLNEVIPEIKYITEHEDYYRKIASIKLPVRLTHNDTKISNVLFDCNTKEGICVIDLDTVMPGYAISDFGDLVRTAAATEDENCVDLEKVKINMEYLKAITNGFLEGSFMILTKEETDNLVNGARLMIYEQAVRFLTDYLMGDQYYKIKYPQQNLIRTRNQIQLLRSLP